MTTRPIASHYATCLTNIHDQILVQGLAPTVTSLSHDKCIAILDSIRLQILTCFLLTPLPVVVDDLTRDPTRGI